MFLREMKKKVFALIEEINPNSVYLTDDTDMQAKINYVINQKMFDLVRIKKMPKYVEFAVNKGDLITFERIERECGYEIYQLGKVSGVRYESKASGTVLKVLEEGTIEIECNVFPERIDEKTNDKAYEFELTSDVLEIMPYGVAADLLKNDKSAEYGRIYEDQYERMLQRLDPRYQTTTVYIKGGYDI